jgi:hypothetical protein
MGLLAKYKRLIGPGMEVKEEAGNKWHILFTDLTKMADFCLIYSKADFAGIDLEVSTAGPCQLCEMVFMGCCSDELLELNSIKAKEMKVKGGELIVHACPLCQIKEAGGLQQLIAETKAGLKMHGLENFDPNSKQEDEEKDDGPVKPKLYPVN